MTVYVLEYEDGECGNIVGLYLTLQAAQQAARDDPDPWHGTVDWGQTTWVEEKRAMDSDRPRWVALTQGQSVVSPGYCVSAWPVTP